MSNILKIKIYLLSNPLHLQYVLEVLNLIRIFDPELLKVVSQYEVFQACIEIEERCYKVIRKSDISKLKKLKDRERDLVILSIRDLLKSALRSLDKNVSEAAYRLKILLDAFDNPTLLIKLSFDAETAAVNSLLEAFEGKYANDVQIVGLTALVKDLRIRNEDFDKLAKDYNKQQAEKPLIRPKEARKNTDKVYHDIITLIDGAIINDGIAPYTSFIAELNTLIKHYNDLAAQHQGYLDAAKEKEKAKEEEEKNSKEETEKQDDTKQESGKTDDDKKEDTKQDDTKV